MYKTIERLKYLDYNGFINYKIHFQAGIKKHLKLSNNKKNY